MHWGNYGWGMGFGWFFMIILSIVIILCVVFLVKLFTRRQEGKYQNEAPLDILKKRYAKGDITREEFEKMKSDLKKDAD